MKIKKQVTRKNWEKLFDHVTTDELAALASAFSKHCYRARTIVTVEDKEIPMPLLTIGEMIEIVGEFKQDIVIEFPTSWFQLFKAQYFPDWLKKKFPIKTTSREKSITLMPAEDCCDSLWDQLVAPVLAKEEKE